jgi:SpoVK/Ycf46/Vps4 family AAA+-type ATPase
MLKRVVRAIADGSTKDLHALAAKIVESERRVGHGKLADELSAMLKAAKVEGLPSGRRALDLSQKLTTLPVSRRHGESLVSLHAPESLEHEMVLESATEERFARLEKEYAARERLGKFGLSHRKTVLLYGPPGCGKSLGAKRLAWNTGLPLMKVRLDSLISSYLGESSSNLASIFTAAKEHACVLLLDECDAIARARNGSKDIGEASRIVNALLQLMDEYDAPGLLVATTNVGESLDPALFRRFDDVIPVPLPGAPEIQRLLRLTLSAVPFAEMINWDRLVRRLEGASAAMVVRAAHWRHFGHCDGRHLSYAAGAQMGKRTPGKRGQRSRSSRAIVLSSACSFVESSGAGRVRMSKITSSSSERFSRTCRCSSSFRSLQVGHRTIYLDAIATAAHCVP